MEYPLLNISILILFVLWSFPYLFLSGGTDKYLHLLIIELIRIMKHNFLSRIDPFLYGDRMGYPQLLHWVLSFFSKKTVKIILKYMPILNNLAVGLMHVLLVYLIISTSDVQLSYKNILITSSLIFISSGLFFNIENAKNRGFSTRGIGIFLTLVYFYSSISFITIGTYIFALVCLVSILLMFLSSQFSVQFLLFSSIPVFILSGELLFLSFPIIGFILFYLLFPKNAINWLSFQRDHKCWYYKYGAKTFILNRRESIWRDFVFDFWNKAFKQRAKSLGYIFSNPVVAVIWGVPILLPVMYYFLFSMTRIQYNFSKSLNLLLIFTCSTIIIFVLTSFKKTRFLGEPERYVEFVISPVAILGAIVFKYNHPIIITCILIGLGYILINYYLYFRLKGNFKNHYSLSALKSRIKKLEMNSIRFLSNNLEITKMILKPNIKAFYGWCIQTEFGKYHFKDIYDRYPIIKDSMIIPLIREYNINLVVIDQNFTESKIEDLFCKIKTNILFQNDDFFLLQIVN